MGMPVFATFRTRKSRKWRLGSRSFTLRSKVVTSCQLQTGMLSWCKIFMTLYLHWKDCCIHDMCMELGIFITYDFPGFLLAHLSRPWSRIFHSVFIPRLMLFVNLLS
jgi:hypothetical protein